MEESKLAIQNELTNEDIKNLIYTIRGKQMMKQKTKMMN